MIFILWYIYMILLQCNEKFSSALEAYDIIIDPILQVSQILNRAVLFNTIYLPIAQTSRHKTHELLI